MHLVKHEYDCNVDYHTVFNIRLMLTNSVIGDYVKNKSQSKKKWTIWLHISNRWNLLVLYTLYITMILVLWHTGRRRNKISEKIYPV